MTYIVCIALLFALTAWVGLRNTKIILNKSLSIHIGKSKQSISFARFSFPAIGVLLLWWFFADYMTHSTPPLGIVIGMGIFAATIIVQGLFPYGQHHAWDKIHDASAWTAACIGPVLLVRFGLESNGFIQLPLLCLGLLSAGILAALLLVLPVRKYFLILQLSMVMISGICFALLAM